MSDLVGVVDQRILLYLEEVLDGWTEGWIEEDWIDLVVLVQTWSLMFPWGDGDDGDEEIFRCCCCCCCCCCGYYCCCYCYDCCCYGCFSRTL